MYVFLITHVRLLLISLLSAHSILKWGSIRIPIWATPPLRR